MAKTVFLDTGPLVALLRERDQFHQWVKVELSKGDFKFITCEPVLTETFFLTRHTPIVVDAISRMIDNGVITLKSALEVDKHLVFEKMKKYSDQNTSLADISLLVLYEQEKEASIFTTDSDFLIYRDSNGNPLNLISPYLK